MKNKIYYNEILLASSFVFFTLSLNAHAFGTADDIDSTVYSEAFNTLDANQDGMLTKPELKKEKLSAKGFKLAATDKNGTLNDEEFTEYKSKSDKKGMKRVATDSMITSKVKAKLLGDEGLKSFKVSVETHDGVVLLSGFVATEEQINLAEKVAMETEGVKSVKNNIVLKK